jgi:hypothetical protein
MMAATSGPGSSGTGGSGGTSGGNGGSTASSGGTGGAASGNGGTGGVVGSNGGSSGAGMTSGGSGGAMGGASSGGSGGAAGGGPPIDGCLMDWRSTDCATSCLDPGRVEWERCQEAVDCFGQNDCGPTSCGSGEGVCGNRLQLDDMTRSFARTVYTCLCG